MELKSVVLGNHAFLVEPDGNTIKVTIPGGKQFSFTSLENLGRIIAIRPLGKRLLIVREYGLETFQTALEPANARLQVIKRNGTRRYINTKQAEYDTGEKKKKVRKTKCQGI